MNLCPKCGFEIGGVLCRCPKPISMRSPSVVVEFDSRGTRVEKLFADCFAARRFYAAKLKAGAKPRVKAAK